MAIIIHKHLGTPKQVEEEAAAEHLQDKILLLHWLSED